MYRPTVRIPATVQTRHGLAFSTLLALFRSCTLPDRSSSMLADQHFNGLGNLYPRARVDVRSEYLHLVAITTTMSMGRPFGGLGHLFPWAPVGGRESFQISYPNNGLHFRLGFLCIFFGFFTCKLVIDKTVFLYHGFLWTALTCDSTSRFGPACVIVWWTKTSRFLARLFSLFKCLPCAFTSRYWPSGALQSL